MSLCSSAATMATPRTTSSDPGTTDPIIDWETSIEEYPEYGQLTPQHWFVSELRWRLHLVQGESDDSSVLESIRILFKEEEEEEESSLDGVAELFFTAQDDSPDSCSFLDGIEELFRQHDDRKSQNWLNYLDGLSAMFREDSHTSEASY